MPNYLVTFESGPDKDRSFAIEDVRNEADAINSAFERAKKYAVARCPVCTSSVPTIKAGLAYGVLEPGACSNPWHDNFIRVRVDRLPLGPKHEN